MWPWAYRRVGWGGRYDAGGAPCGELWRIGGDWTRCRFADTQVELAPGSVYVECSHVHAIGIVEVHVKLMRIHGDALTAWCVRSKGWLGVDGPAAKCRRCWHTDVQYGMTCGVKA